ncbi:aminotransferase class I/II-fold pyridoxal phosphate-dependent enzyme [Planctomicrobium sp. SH527]|uniref:aminotransferase class I/II-fold pyridoxal phosphate-dependent enzyme n=1 Tax=Planctomicrobium sp. SH527 TaxID=3448123 RepID=UPI003F5C9AAF
MNQLQTDLIEQLSALEERGLRRRKRTVSPLSNGRCLLNQQTVWNFAANDYLGIADDPRLIQAAISAMRESGIGARASALVTGHTIWHERLEERICRFKQAESAILFPTGYAANVGTITALASSDDVILCDRLNHASLIDGSRLSKATFKVIAHADPEAYRKQLERESGYRRRIMVTDSVFSMDGDHAPLKQMAALAEEFDALLIVDEAHATGVFGERGTGLLSAQQVISDRVIPVGTLSKAIGLQGGFVTGSEALTDWLWNSARPQVFSTALPVPICAAAIAAFDLIEAEPQRREWLAVNSQRIITALHEQGWNVPDEARGPVIPVLIGEENETLRLASLLEQREILVAAIRPPTVPHGTSRLRISLSYSHGEEGIQAFNAAMDSIKRERR